MKPDSQQFCLLKTFHQKISVTAEALCGEADGKTMENEYFAKLLQAGIVLGIGEDRQCAFQFHYYIILRTV